MTTAVQDFKVADLALADFGRKEIILVQGNKSRGRTPSAFASFPRLTTPTLRSPRSMPPM